MEALWRENIGTGVHFKPVHLHTFYQQKYGFRVGDYPNAEEIGERTLSLPMSAALTADDVQDVIAAVVKLVTHFRE
jgi:dTDP-4-amino-4,6-dideoxygalactose transaminase